MFAATAAIDCTGSAASCVVELVGARALTLQNRAMAEEVYAEALRQKLGGSKAMFRSHCAWKTDPASSGGLRWTEACSLARFMVEERLVAMGLGYLGSDGVGEARFEMEFIHALS